MSQVSYTRMADGTQEDYQLVIAAVEEDVRALPGRIMQAVRELDRSFDIFKVSRLEHSLQSATRAYRDGRDEAYVVACVVHDIGDELAPFTHGSMVEAIIKPFVPAEIAWIIKYHPLFQLYYYGHHIGVDRHARDRFKDHPYYDACVEFCEKYDQNCFDPEYESLPLEFFEPMVTRIFSRAPNFVDEG
jgi:predicted HD phosphohydrolase